MRTDAQNASTTAAIYSLFRLGSHRLWFLLLSDCHQAIKESGVHEGAKRSAVPLQSQQKKPWCLTIHILLITIHVLLDCQTILLLLKIDGLNGPVLHYLPDLVGELHAHVADDDREHDCDAQALECLKRIGHVDDILGAAPN